MSFREYAGNAESDLSLAVTRQEGAEQRATVAMAQVWATLALAEAIREMNVVLERR